MPLSLPVLDDRNFEQLLDEAQRRIAVHTPEWSNFESDPGTTLVEVFAFLTDGLLYRANRIPERNRLKFLQLLGVGLQPASPATGLVTIRNERGPVRPLVLERGAAVSAGNVSFVTRDPVNVLPVEARVLYKKTIPATDPRYADLTLRHKAILLARQAEQAQETGTAPLFGDASLTTNVQPSFYETTPMSAPTPSDPSPEVDLTTTTDQAVYIALLAPQNVLPQDVRAAIGNQILSLGIVPALAGDVPPLRPLQPATRRAPGPNLVYEIANVPANGPVASWARLRVLQGPDVLTAVGIVQIELPGVDGLQTWDFSEPLEEGMGDFPPRLEENAVRERLVTWIRIRLPQTDDSVQTNVPGAALGQESTQHDTRLTWVGINTTRVEQATPIFNELLGQGNGEPDQTTILANTPVIKNSISLVIEDDNGIGQPWRLTDDLLAAGERDRVFTLDPESGQIRFGDGLRGARPPAGRRILASYEFGGGSRGNVGIGAINASRDVRLQGGYKVENPVPTSGGSAGESAADGERNIPMVLRHRERLVTVQDFKDVTWRTPGVDMGRVEVLSLFNPMDEREDAAGVVTVMVIPRFDALHPLWPQPDRLFLRRVCDHLDLRRLVTTELYVRGPIYVDVYVSVGIQVLGGFFPDKVRQMVRERLNGYLSALPPGGPLGQGWPLKKQLHGKDLEAVVTRVPGVEFVHNLEMGVGSKPEDIPDYNLDGLHLPRLVGLSVREGRAEPVATIFAPTPSAELPGETEFVPVPVIREKC